MPIDIDEFEAATPEELRGDDRPVRDGVLEFLAYDPGMAYSREEIQSSLQIDAIHLLHELTQLEREGLVRHKGHYWAIADGYEGDPSLGEKL